MQIIKLFNPSSIFSSALCRVIPRSAESGLPCDESKRPGGGASFFTLARLDIFPISIAQSTELTRLAQIGALNQLDGGIQHRRGELWQDTRSRFLLVEGPLQNQDNVIYVKATRLTALPDRALEVRSHDSYQPEHCQPRLQRSAFVSGATERAQTGLLTDVGLRHHTYLVPYVYFMARVSRVHG